MCFPLGGASVDQLVKTLSPSGLALMNGAMGQFVANPSVYVASHEWSLGLVGCQSINPRDLFLVEHWVDDWLAVSLSSN